ncbi:MAG: FHA domain-containing protein [Proteobacteria bacterium]|nr:FHA domain-containing protein [Pseudomonadota bacterium]MBU1716293.1 FHA domain-containing protein [Pseudomonadota bacterium]
MDEWMLTLHDRVIKRFTINEGESLSIGRGKSANVMVDNSAISREHSCLELKGGNYFISDLYSLNGTKVNGEKIESSVPITKTDLIEIGKFRLQPADSEAQDTVGSFSAAMDMNDATIFVGSKAKTGAPATGESPKKAEHMLVVISGTASPGELVLDGKDSIKIGKSSSCDMVMSGWFVADTQCYIIKKDRDYLLIPQSGWKKIMLNGAKINDEQTLLKGDIIEISGTRIRFD